MALTHLPQMVDMESRETKRRWSALMAWRVSCDGSNNLQVVFNQSGERESSLSKSAAEMEDAFGRLMQQLVSGSVPKSPRSACNLTAQSSKRLQATCLA